jgi:hypothetical protein
MEMRSGGSRQGDILCEQARIPVRKMLKREGFAIVQLMAGAPFQGICRRADHFCRVKARRMLRLVNFLLFGGIACPNPGVPAGEG